MILANTNTKESQLNVYPYLCLLKDGEYADIMIQVASRGWCERMGLSGDVNAPLLRVPDTRPCEI